MKKVVIISKHIPQYRMTFYSLLRERLKEQGVELVLIYGQPNGFESAKGDSVDLDWATRINNRYIRIGDRELIWQPCWSLLKNADIVIVEQAGKLLLNYLLVAASKLGIKKVAYWGHGKNFQAHTENRLNGWLKNKLINQVDWWFCYNDYGAKGVLSSGFPREKVTIVNNAVDTKRIAEGVDSITDQKIESIKKELGISSSNVAVYVGGMYAEKRLEFLLDACLVIRRLVSDFEMVFVGSGVDAGLVEKAAKEHVWIHYIGPKFFEELDVYLAMAKVQLMPGLVGLGVLDSFASETPMVTTAISYHSPEIDYLINGENGLIVNNPDDMNTYAKEVSKLMMNKGELEHLKEGGRIAKGIYTVESMADRFAAGVIKAL
jgi:glycosyltransferase involved in cell wall biosynthesis